MSRWNEAGSANFFNAIDQRNAQEPGSRGNGEMVDVPAGFGVIQHDNIVYADMLPPFDVTMTFANEYGQAAFQKIYDVDILNEGSGVSVDSVVMERQMTFIAPHVTDSSKGVYAENSPLKVPADNK